MKNEEALALLKKGANFWNEWKSNTKQRPILDGIVIDGLEIGAVDFSNCSLQKATIRNSDLQSAKFLSADLSGASLQNCNLSNTRFIAASLEKAQLSHCNLSGASLLTANVRGASLEHLDFRGLELRSLDLRETSLANSNLEGQHLASLDLSGVNLKGAQLQNSDLRYTQLNNAVLLRANITGAQLEGANFRGAKLNDIDFNGHDLGNIDFSKAEMRNCDLRNTNLNGAKLNNCDITGSKLANMQANDWSISGIKCDFAYWNESTSEKTYYNAHEFERIYARNLSFSLQYPYRLMANELSTLPIFIEHLEAKFWGIVIRLKSIEDIAGGALLTFAIEEPGHFEPEKLKTELLEEATRIQMAQVAMRQEPKLQHDLKEDLAKIKEKFWPLLLELSAAHDREQVRNLTVVFMDLKGFSQWGDDELSDKLALFRGLIKPILTQWQAGHPNMEGDSLRVTFRNASAGLACACMMRGVLSSAGFEVRTGVEMGEVTVIHNEVTDLADLEGSSLILAARLEAAAVPGQVLATERIRHYTDHKGLFKFTPVRAVLGKSVGEKKKGDIIDCYAVEVAKPLLDFNRKK